MCNRGNARDVAACPDEWSTKSSELNKPGTNQDKHRERSPNFCYTLNSWEHMPLTCDINRMRHKKNISQWRLIAEAGIRGCFLVKPNSQNFLNFPEHCQQVSGNLQLCLKKQFHWNVFLGNLGSFWNSYSQKLDILLCFFTIDIPFANFIYSSPNLWN